MMFQTKHRVLVCKLRTALAPTRSVSFDKDISIYEVCHPCLKNQNIVWLDIGSRDPIFYFDIRYLESITIVAPIPCTAYLPKTFARTAYIKSVLAIRMLGN